MSTIVVMMFWFVVILRFTRRTVRIRKAKIAIIFFSRHLDIFLYIWINQLNAKKWDEPCRHRNENTAHYRSQCSLTASVADKKCAFIVCSHMPFQFKCCVRGEITMLTYIWRLFTEEQAPAGSRDIPGFFQNPDPGILKNLIPGFFGISRSP